MSPTEMAMGCIQFSVLDQEAACALITAHPKSDGSTSGQALPDAAVLPFPAHLTESGLLFSWAGKAAGGAVSGSLFQPDLIVDGLPQPLLAAQVSLRGLHRNVAQQELNLLQFAARRMT